MNHIRKAFENKIDDFTHKKFIRYGIGEFEKEDFIIKKSKGNIVVSSGFEYVDVFQKIIAKHLTGPVKLKGIIVSLTDIKKDLANLGLEPIKVTGKKYTIDQEVSKDTYKKMVDTFSNTFMLLAVDTKDFLLKTKTSVPKPGNLAPKFCTLTVSDKLLSEIIDEFLFDVKSEIKDFKSVLIKPVYEIIDIKIPTEKDPKLARELAKRQIKFTRTIKVDLKEYTKSFEALV